VYTCIIYVACEDHVLYYIIICGLFGPPCLLNSTMFGKKFIEHKMSALICSTTFVRNISHSTTN